MGLECHCHDAFVKGGLCFVNFVIFHMFYTILHGLQWGDTPLDAAKEKGHRQVMDALERHNAR